MKQSEVIIVGAGPAGSSCAWKLKRHGVDVLLLDRQAFPRIKLCAGWITPSVVRDLELSEESYPHTLKRFSRLNISFKGIRLPVRTHQYAIRRIELDNWLVERSDVPLIRHDVATMERKEGWYIIDGQFRCRYLVGAGGTGCRVYKTLFKSINSRASERLITTMEEEFPYDVRNPECYLWYFDHKLPGYSWYVPKSEGIVNVGVGGKLEGLKRQGRTIRYHWNRLTEKLEKRGLVKDYAFSPKGHNYYIRDGVEVVQSENAYIVGDAAGLATVDMGEGIGPAVQSGLLAARSIIEGTPYSIASIGRYSFPHILFPNRKRPGSD